MAPLASSLMFQRRRGEDGEEGGEGATRKRERAKLVGCCNFHHETAYTRYWIMLPFSESGVVLASTLNASAASIDVEFRVWSENGKTMTNSAMMLAGSCVHKHANLGKRGRERELSEEEEESK